MKTESILWRKLDGPGHEHARLSPWRSGRRLAGTALFIHGGRPCRLDYSLECDARWRFLRAEVSGWAGAEQVKIAVSRDARRKWKLDGKTQTAVEGCTELDLSFSPASNLLPMRRLALGVGQKAAVRAAWLRLPGLAFEPLELVYRRTGPSTYRYESPGGSFELEVNGEGFVTRYPGFWAAER